MFVIAMVELFPVNFKNSLLDCFWRHSKKMENFPMSHLVTTKRYLLLMLQFWNTEVQNQSLVIDNKLWNWVQWNFLYKLVSYANCPQEFIFLFFLFLSNKTLLSLAWTRPAHPAADLISHPSEQLCVAMRLSLGSIRVWAQVILATSGSSPWRWSHWLSTSSSLWLHSLQKRTMSEATVGHPSISSCEQTHIHEWFSVAD